MKSEEDIRVEVEELKSNLTDELTDLQALALTNKITTLTEVLAGLDVPMELRRHKRNTRISDLVKMKKKLGTEYMTGKTVHHGGEWECGILPRLNVMTSAKPICKVLDEEEHKRLHGKKFRKVN